MHARAVWYITRRLVLTEDQRGALLCELEGREAFKESIPPLAPLAKARWFEMVEAIIKDGEVDWPWILDLPWPSTSEVCMFEMETLQAVVDKVTQGTSKTSITKTMYREWGLPFYFCGEVLTLADRAATLMTVGSKGMILAGMEADIRLATLDGDVRARIMARKSLAQATGALQSDERRTPAQDVIDVLKEISNLASKKQITNEPPTR
jgi:hypothetical protein